MIETLAAHKVALMLGLALIGVVLVIRARGVGASTASAAIPVNPYSSTPPSSGDVGGALSLPSANPYAQAAQPSASGGEATGTGAGPSVSEASTSTGPGAGPTLAAPTLPAGTVIDPATGTTTNQAGYPTNTSYADLGIAPDPINVSANSTWISSSMGGASGISVGGPAPVQSMIAAHHAAGRDPLA